MHNILAITLAGLLMSSVSLSVAYADDSSSSGQKSDNSGDKGDGGKKPKADAFAVSYGKTGDTKATPDGVKILGVETFAGLQPGQQIFKTDYGTGGAVVGLYTDLSIKTLQTSGGSGDSEGEDGNKAPKTYVNVADAFSESPYTVNFSTGDGKGVDYFGFYMPTADAGATLTFYRKGVAIGSLTGAKIDGGFKGGSEDGGGDGQNGSGNAKGHFVNIFDKSGAFDEIKFSDGSEEGTFATENHTVGSFDNGSGGGGGAVPEPAAWTMMIVGVGLIGGALRRRRAGVAAAARA